MFSCSTYGRATQSTRSNDAVANLHCVNTKWVIWKRCWHVDPVIKPNAFTYSVNAPVQCNVHPYIHSSFKKKDKRDAWAIWLWLGPWRNHYPHDPKLLIPYLTLPSVSHFSHSLDKFIYMKDHSRWYRPAGKWQSYQRFHAILPSLSCTCSPRAVVSVSLINLPRSHDWRDQHVLIILPWFELDQRSVQLHKHSTIKRDKHSASALCIQKAVQGQGKTRSDSFFPPFSVCLSVWVLP